MFLSPVGEHELLLFWVQLAVLLGAARSLGGLLQRFGQPAVVGELSAGLLLGPSVLGRIAPDLARTLFPGGDVESALVLAVSWLGIVLLLVITGFETDLQLLARLGRASAAVSVGSLVVPLLLGFGLAFVLPTSYIGQASNRLVFAMFIAVALSISALPVIAKVLQDMRLMRRDFGQITLAAGMVNDSVGWLLLGTLTGIVSSGGFQVGRLLFMMAAILGFVVFALTLGQRIVNTALRQARRAGEGFLATFTATVLTAIVAGAMTAAIGMEAVIGAFVSGIVLGRSRYLPDDVRRALEQMTHAVFAPIFFATAGLYVDLGTLLSPLNAVAALEILAVAGVAKLGGSYVGGRVSRLSRMESLAVGVGLNARGAMEIVLVTIGLRLQVLSNSSYTAIVLMAMATSLAAPPLLRPVLRRLEAGPEEAERLEREELLAESIIAKAEHALLPTRGGANSLLAARMLDVVLQPEASVTVITVSTPDATDTGQIEGRTQRVREVFAERASEWRREVSDDPAEVILDEAQLGYELMALGLTEEFRGTHQLSGHLQRLLAETRIPVLLVSRPSDSPDRRGLADGHFRRLLVPITGTTAGRAAEEIAYVIASHTGAEVDAVHVLSRTDKDRRTNPWVETQLRRARNLAKRFGGGASPLVRFAPTAYDELMATANERGTDLIVAGAQVRSHEGRAFLGHGTEYLLEHAKQPLLVLVFPSEPVTRG